MSQSSLSLLRQRLVPGIQLVLVKAEFSVKPEQFIPFIVVGQSDEGLWGETAEGEKRFLPIGCSTSHTTVEVEGDEFTVRLTEVPKSGLTYRIWQRENARA